MFGGNFSGGYVADRREERTRVGVGPGREHRLPRRPIIERRGTPVQAFGRPPAELAAVIEQNGTTVWEIGNTASNFILSSTVPLQPVCHNIFMLLSARSAVTVPSHSITAVFSQYQILLLGGVVT